MNAYERLRLEKQIYKPYEKNGHQKKVSGLHIKHCQFPRSTVTFTKNWGEKLAPLLMQRIQYIQLSGSQPWLHFRITKRAFKKYLWPGPIPQQLNENFQGMGLQTVVVLKAPQVTVKCNEGWDSQTDIMCRDANRSWMEMYCCSFYIISALEALVFACMLLISLPDFSLCPCDMGPPNAHALPSPTIPPGLGRVWTYADYNDLLISW